MGEDYPEQMVEGIELSRPARGLRMWLPLHYHGTRAFREVTLFKILLTQHLYRKMTHLANSLRSRGVILELGPRPDLTIFVFRFRSALLDEVNGDGENHTGASKSDLQSELNKKMVA